ncbi:MAG: hypothetical protein P1U64_06045 [Alcanivoracaceae bacterium]|nr:hypothetical protein [Alcanivoracaceae bacterium]
MLPRLILIAVAAVAASLARADDAALDRFNAMQEKIAAACQSAPDGDLCQAFRHGVLQGVDAFSVQAEKLSADWGLAHERALSGHFRGPRADMAWVARDVLNAVSCSPDPLDFVSASAGEGSPAGQAAERVQRFCGPIWQVQRLRPWVGTDVHMAVTQR